jgi:hypothetical protein
MDARGLSHGTAAQSLAVDRDGPGRLLTTPQSPSPHSSAAISSLWNNSHQTEGAGTRLRLIPMASKVSRVSRRPHRTIPN